MTVVQKSCIQILALGYHNRHIYMIFSLSLCGVTPGNHAKTQARRKGSRKVGTSVSMHVWTIIIIIYYILITDFIIKVFL